MSDIKKERYTEIIIEITIASILFAYSYIIIVLNV